MSAMTTLRRRATISALAGAVIGFGRAGYTVLTGPVPENVSSGGTSFAVYLLGMLAGGLVAGILVGAFLGPILWLAWRDSEVRQ